MPRHYVAIDIGGASGRIMLGKMTDMKLDIQEAHRFSVAPLQARGKLFCNVYSMWEEIKTGLRKVSLQHCVNVDGIGISTWAQDCALLDRTGTLVDLPFFYRDRRDQSILDQLHIHFSEWDLYKITGISDYAASSLCQLLSIKLNSPNTLDTTHKLLFLPSLFIYWLSGYQMNELTVAAVSQLCDLQAANWSTEIFQRLNLPTKILTEITPSNTVLGSILPSVAEDIGLKKTSMIATACHDTAAAVAAVPTTENNSIFIISGTWSIIGTELTKPLMTNTSLQKYFLNELGLDNRIVFAYNSAGLWILQECYREWFGNSSTSAYVDVVGSDKSPPFLKAIIDPNSPCFFRPGNMPTKIADYCLSTGQDIPITPNDFTRVIIESLALRYRKSIDDLEQLVKLRTDKIYIVGGGSRNAFLCQSTADATGKSVVAGPAEATSSATILLQAISQKELSSLTEIREIISCSSSLIRYEPTPNNIWDEAYESFISLSRLNL